MAGVAAFESELIGHMAGSSIHLSVDDKNKNSSNMNMIVDYNTQNLLRCSQCIMFCCWRQHMPTSFALKLLIEIHATQEFEIKKNDLNRDDADLL